jgi:hypothetical protein
LIVNLWLLAWVFFANSGSRDDISPIARRHTGTETWYHIWISDYQVTNRDMTSIFYFSFMPITMGL